MKFFFFPFFFFFLPIFLLFLRSRPSPFRNGRRIRRQLFQDKQSKLRLSKNSVEDAVIFLGFTGILGMDKSVLERMSMEFHCGLLRSPTSPGRKSLNLHSSSSETFMGMNL